MKAAWVKIYRQVGDWLDNFHRIMDRIQPIEWPIHNTIDPISDQVWEELRTFWKDTPANLRCDSLNPFQLAEKLGRPVADDRIRLITRYYCERVNFACWCYPDWAY